MPHAGVRATNTTGRINSRSALRKNNAECVSGAGEETGIQFLAISGADRTRVTWRGACAFALLSGLIYSRRRISFSVMLRLRPNVVKVAVLSLTETRGGVSKRPPPDELSRAESPRAMKTRMEACVSCRRTVILGVRVDLSPSMVTQRPAKVQDRRTKALAQREIRLEAACSYRKIQMTRSTAVIPVVPPHRPPTRIPTTPWS